MAKQPGQQEPLDLSAMLKDFKSDLATSSIEASIRQAENTLAMRFIWHPWADIPNLAVNKIRGNTKYMVLPRMELIPLFAWPVPVILPANSGIGSLQPNGYGAVMGPIGTVVKQRSMLAFESQRYFEKWYGNLGCRVIECLTAETDIEKVEAFVLYEGVMKNTRPVLERGEEGGRTMAGVDVCIQDLPEFLSKDAPAMLDHVLRNGVDFKGGDLSKGLTPGLYKLRPAARQKGEAMIKELGRNVGFAVDMALNEETGILVVSRGELQAAAAHVAGAKARLDRRDEFLLKQFPDFSMDTAVERASRANQSVVSSIDASTRSNASVQEQMLVQNAEAMELQRMMLEELRDTKLALGKVQVELAEVKQAKAS